ncbi:MAG: farnesyl diphosphate synthase [Candidatus Sericytochromatia bacterium]
MKYDFELLDKYLLEKKKIIELKLDEYLPINNDTKLAESMRYSLLAGGKRLRPALTLAVIEALNGNIYEALPSACAIEMIHTQSLIHDDLPGMDNDDLRRGKPTNHVIFGEALAIIAGDALFSHAFNIIVSKTPKTVNPELILKVIEEISNAAGYLGMCGGQAKDISFEKSSEPVTKEVLEYIHKHKTGDMITVSIRTGAILSKATEKELELLTQYSENIGLAFQIIDDIMDVTKTAEELGKKTNKDENKNKATYPRLYGVDKSYKIAEEKVSEALSCIEFLGEKGLYLKLLAEYIIFRNN